MLFVYMQKQFLVLDNARFKTIIGLEKEKLNKNIVSNVYFVLLCGVTF